MDLRLIFILVVGTPSFAATQHCGARRQPFFASVETMSSRLVRRSSGKSERNSTCKQIPSKFPLLGGLDAANRAHDDPRGFVRVLDTLAALAWKEACAMSVTAACTSLAASSHGPVTQSASPAVPAPVPAQVSATQASRATEPSYTVTLTSLSPPHFLIHANLSLKDDTLRVAGSRPCDLASICSAGWPTLISEFRVTDSQGGPVQTTSLGPAGWLVPQPHGSHLILDYAVDFATLADHAWPAPRETAYSDGMTLYTLGRPLFVGSHTADTIHVRFIVPAGMTTHAPWRPGNKPGEFQVAGVDALWDNGIVITPRAIPRVAAQGFTLELALFGRWNARRDLVAHLMNAHVATFTRLLGFNQPARYLATFLPDSDLGGESFSDSYALSACPDSSVATWGRVIGHELFHYWNGQRLRGADYISSQWFQEGMTEYYAIVSMARNHFVTADEAFAQLAHHLRAHQQFGKSLTASGGHKDQGFYGSATLVALVLDMKIRDATRGRRSLDDMMRTMWRTFGSAGRPYTQADVIAVANATAGRDLTEFFRAHVEGAVPLPVDSAALRSRVAAGL
jgi:hypothetical protein